ncbi:MAG: hypothetical protein J7527_15395, partial [Chitinophagaceae bacterium]|nr:hypothetical protein [Chitinophagaceae bacterium]
MIRRYKYALLILLFLAQIHGALGQQSLTVFVDKGFFRDGGRDLINTWLEQLKRGYSCTVRYDSTGVFKGEGIYLTLTDRDRYRRAPVALRSRGLEACYIRSTTNGVYITANSMDGLQNALYLFLEKLGFRYYFPEPAWHIIPIVKKFPVINEVIEPSFANRQLAMGWGHGNPEMAKRFSFWETANRM